MSGFTCPYCNMVFALDGNTKRSEHISYGDMLAIYRGPTGVKYADSTIEVLFYKCPSCEEYSIQIIGHGAKVLGINTWIKPRSLAKQFPSFIPQSIREDYEEAYSILSLSPKASAALSRRCLQGMIRDFWGIKGKTLNDEISALKDQIQPDLWQALNDLRQLGNIGSHMEKDINVIIDIDEGEAERLVKLVELLIEEWYITRHKRNMLLKEINEINEDKQAKRKGEE